MKMRIREFAKIAGVSVRTLHYYDEIGLLKPAFVDKQTGYRYYNEESLLRMQEILFYRELDFPLKTIRDILISPNYSKEAVLREQKALLTLKKERLEKLIHAIDGAMKGENIMKAFDSSTVERYKAEAKERWGNTDAYREYSEKAKNRTGSQQQSMVDGMADIFAEFADCLNSGAAADSPAAQALAEKLQNFITANCYNCTKQILAGLGQMYVLDERFTANIDSHGAGTAAFVSQAIAAYCK